MGTRNYNTFNCLARVRAPQWQSNIVHTPNRGTGWNIRTLIESLRFNSKLGWLFRLQGLISKLLIYVAGFRTLLLQFSRRPLYHCSVTGAPFQCVALCCSAVSHSLSNLFRDQLASIRLKSPGIRGLNRKGFVIFAASIQWLTIQETKAPILQVR